MYNKIISYSLWGNNPIYTFGALENVYLAKIIFPDWKVRIYYNSIPNGILNELKLCDNCELIFMKTEKYNFQNNSIWRFLPFFDDKVDIFISRDTDSRLCNFDKYYIDKWIDDYEHDFMSINDMQINSINIHAGMFGVKKYKIEKNTINNINKFYIDYIPKLANGYYKRAEKKLSDENLLRDIVSTFFNNNFLYVSPCNNLVNDINIIKFTFDTNKSTISRIIYNCNYLNELKIIDFLIKFENFAKKRIHDENAHNFIINIAKTHINNENIEKYFVIND